MFAIRPKFSKLSQRYNLLISLYLCGRDFAMRSFLDQVVGAILAYPAERM